MESLFLGLVEDDAGSESVDLRPVFWVLVAGNLLLWVKVILFLESSVGGDVVVERIDDLHHAVSELQVLFVDPQVLIWEFPLVIRIWVLWSQLWLDSCLKIHLGISLEKMWQQLLLDLVDLLEGSDTLLEDGEDGRDDFLGGRAVLGSLVLTDEKIDVEQWEEDNMQLLQEGRETAEKARALQRKRKEMEAEMQRRKEEAERKKKEEAAAAAAEVGS